jgi:hypothetical protein
MERMETIPLPINLKKVREACVNPAPVRLDTEWHRHSIWNTGVSAAEVRAFMSENDAVLNSITAFIRRFVFLSESQARVATVWIMHTHAFASATSTPYLAITSAEKQSGKTRLLEVFDMLVANPWFTGSVSAAVLSRKIDAKGPTLLLDESDAAFSGEKEYAEALRGVLNTGHRSGGMFSRCVGQGAKMEPRDFSTFCPKAIAGIGKLPDTIADRAIPIRLKRAIAGERVERFRRRDVGPETEELRKEIEEWCASYGDKLVHARPDLPAELTDRQQDGAEPLLAIADVVGGSWPEALRLALVELCTEAQASDGSIGVQLLADIRQIFEARGVDRMASSELVGALAEIETSPWAEWSHGKPITPGKLARLLSRYEIGPRTVRLPEKTAKGYFQADFADAWVRYLSLPSPVPPSQKVTTVTSFNFSEIEPNGNVTGVDRVTTSNEGKLPAINNVSDVTFSSLPGEREQREPGEEG